MPILLELRCLHAYWLTPPPHLRAYVALHDAFTRWFAARLQAHPMSALCVVVSVGVV